MWITSLIYLVLKLLRRKPCALPISAHAGAGNLCHIFPQKIRRNKLTGFFFGGEFHLGIHKFVFGSSIYQAAFELSALGKLIDPVILANHFSVQQVFQP